MHRVLSFQMARGPGESSEYVTKRLCFSFLFSVGFLCLLCGFLLGRFTVERSMEARAQKTRLELAGNGLRNTEYLQRLTLQKLEEASFNHEHATEWETPDTIEANMRYINGFFSNLSFIDKVTNYASCIQAIVRGSHEPDRYIIISVNGDGVAVALELLRVLDQIYSAHNWRPRRNLIFCISLVPLDVCSQTLSNFIWQKIVTYVTVHGHFIANSRLVLSGSDVMRSIAVEAIRTIPNLNSGNNNLTYEYEVLAPRFFMNIPHVLFSFNESNLGQNQTYPNQNMRLRSITLAQMVSQTIWRLSESIIIQWKPKYFNETVNRILESIDTSKFQAVKEKLTKTLKLLLTALKDLNKKIDETENTQILRVRILNDLLLDLDRMLLYLNEDSHSKNNLTMLRELSPESTKVLIYFNDMANCYEDAIQILDEK